MGRDGRWGVGEPRVPRGSLSTAGSFPLPLASTTAGTCGVQKLDELMQGERPLHSRLPIISLSFPLHLLCTANNLQQSLLLYTFGLTRLSHLHSPGVTMQPPPLSFDHFIMALLNILLPIVPTELVCDNMKI